jgi:hypothetical protein
MVHVAACDIIDAIAKMAEKMIRPFNLPLPKFVLACERFCCFSLARCQAQQPSARARAIAAGGKLLDRALQTLHIKRLIHIKAHAQ